MKNKVAADKYSRINLNHNCDFFSFYVKLGFLAEGRLKQD